MQIYFFPSAFASHPPLIDHFSSPPLSSPSFFSHYAPNMVQTGIWVTLSSFSLHPAVSVKLVQSLSRVPAWKNKKIKLQASPRGKVTLCEKKKSYILYAPDKQAPSHIYTGSESKMYVWLCSLLIHLLSRVGICSCYNSYLYKIKFFIGMRSFCIQCCFIPPCALFRQLGYWHWYTALWK